MVGFSSLYLHFTLMLWFSGVWMCYNRQLWPLCASVPPVGLYLCKSHHIEWQGIIKNCSESYSGGETLQMSIGWPTECKRVLLPEQTGATNAVNAFAFLLGSHFYKDISGCLYCSLKTRNVLKESSVFPHDFNLFSLTFHSCQYMQMENNSHAALGLYWILAVLRSKMTGILFRIVSIVCTCSWKSFRQMFRL